MAALSLRAFSGKVESGFRKSLPREGGGWNPVFPSENAAKSMKHFQE
jgi:hypothetical protein